MRGAESFYPASSLVNFINHDFQLCTSDDSSHQWYSELHNLNGK